MDEKRKNKEWRGEVERKEEEEKRNRERKEEKKENERRSEKKEEGGKERKKKDWRSEAIKKANCGQSYSKRNPLFASMLLSTNYLFAVVVHEPFDIYGHGGCTFIQNGEFPDEFGLNCALKFL